MTADTFNEWRKNYKSMSNKEHLDFYDRLEAEYPNQKHFDADAFKDFFGQNPNAQWVMEIGGWKGEMASLILPNQPNIVSWDNYEVCQSAIEKSVVRGLPYHALRCFDFDWFKARRIRDYDLCIAAHMIEHLSNAHFRHLAQCIAGIPKIMFEAPLLKPGETWHNYMGTHILEFTWPEVNAIMATHGYKSKEIKENIWQYELDVTDNETNG